MEHWVRLIGWLQWNAIRPGNRTARVQSAPVAPERWMKPVNTGLLDTPYTMTSSSSLWSATDRSLGLFRAFVIINQLSRSFASSLPYQLFNPALFGSLFDISLHLNINLPPLLLPNVQRLLLSTPPPLCCQAFLTLSICVYLACLRLLPLLRFPCFFSSCQSLISKCPLFRYTFSFNLKLIYIFFGSNLCCCLPLCLSVCVFFRPRPSVCSPRLCVTTQDSKRFQSVI